MAHAYNVWLRECKLDASYSYFMPVGKVANLKMTRGEMLFLLYDNST